MVGAGGALLLFLDTLLIASDGAPLSPPLQGLILLNLLLVSLLLLAATRWLPWGWSLLRDAAAGEAECFEDRRGDAVVHRLELLPRSGLTWSVNGVRARYTSLARRLAVAEVADIPAFASIAAEWVEPFRTPNGETIHVGQRELSLPELGELRRLRTFLTARPAGVGAVLTAWTLGAWFFHLTTGGYPVGHNRVVLLLLVAAAGVADLHAWRVLRLAARLSADVRGGRVGILRKPRQELKSVLDTPPLLSDAVEVLPTSGLAWTEAGRPARWRLMPPR